LGFTPESSIPPTWIAKYWASSPSFSAPDFQIGSQKCGSLVFRPLELETVPAGQFPTADGAVEAAPRLPGKLPLHRLGCDPLESGKAAGLEIAGGKKTRLLSHANPHGGPKLLPLFPHGMGKKVLNKLPIELIKAGLIGDRDLFRPGRDHDGLEVFRAQDGASTAPAKLAPKTCANTGKAHAPFARRANARHHCPRMPLPERFFCSKNPCSPKLFRLVKEDGVWPNLKVHRLGTFPEDEEAVEAELP